MNETRMNETRIATRISAVAGIAVLILTLAEVPLYFIYSGPPPAWDVLVRDLATILALTALIVFLAGFRELVRQAGPAHEWVAGLISSAGAAYVAIDFVATSLEAGPAIAHPGRHIDPTTTGPLAIGDILLHGSAERAITALLCAAISVAIFRTRCVPRYLGRLSLATAIANLACVPSLFFGPDAARFYSALGWGNSALTAALFGLWVGLAGAALLRDPEPRSHACGADTGRRAGSAFST